ncbi:hypothetical protein Agabi119p4_9923 [Agaricus bisporus var. burnettii]|uniref:Glycosyltransferase 61 catalytic domain-containing protein n=1 Tax=Agaricus bisporus var. burnettii TaxID=192524 RepID=A0A8H7C4Q0_AGABI|nr:hypothetical protein Agabi119p4_9923 [Agaricus bisporus var. burnettii]
MPFLRRCLTLGVLASLFSAAFLGLFFLDVDLPTQLHGFKVAASNKLKLTSGNVLVEENANSHIPSGGKSPHGGVDGNLIVDSFDSFHSTTNNIRLTSSLKTTIPNGATTHGFNVFDNLVVHNGIFYIVTHNRSAFPEKKEYIVDKPWDDKQPVEREPSAEDIQFITPDELVGLLGDSAIRIDGFSWIMYDVPQFMGHYYHWWGEIILGGWLVYSRIGLDKSGAFHPELLEWPKRFLLPIVTEGKWRDKSRLVGPFMRAAFPAAVIEERDQWLDFIRLNSTIVFDRALITNRMSAHKHRFGGRWSKMIAGTQELQVATFDPTSTSTPEHEGFWSPIRKLMTLNLLGYIPTFESPTNRTVISPSHVKSSKPVVIYLNRQKTGRRLDEESHESLVEALKGLEEDGICEVQIVRMEEVGLREQIRLVSRSTIMVGVHGNGLTHQLWMPPSKRSSVIEIVMPGSYEFDYEIVARNVGHKHYMVWNDTLLTYKTGTYHKGIKYLPGFHGVSIPVYGPAVAEKIRHRLLGTEGDDAEKIYDE